MARNLTGRSSNLFSPLTFFFFLQIETEYGKGAWSGNIYRDVVAFPGNGEIITHENNRWLQFNE